MQIYKEVYFLNILKNYFHEPFKQLRNTKTLTTCSMLIALSVISSVIITFYPDITLKFSIAFIFTAIIASKYGPFIAAVSAALTDVIQYLVKPVGAYILPLTLTCALTGFLFGFFFYREKTKLWRIIVAQTINCIFISTLLNSFILSFYVGKAFEALIVARVVKNFIMLPIEILILFFIFSALKKIKKTIK